MCLYCSLGPAMLPQVYGWESRHAEALAIFLIALVTTLGALGTQLLIIREPALQYARLMSGAGMLVSGSALLRGVTLACLVDSKAPYSLGCS